MTKIWIISDLHFFHKNIIEYSNRPDDYEKRLEKGLAMIGDGDILICLGDITIGKDQEVHDKYIKPLKCKKWLIKGNHDNKSITWYINNGWDAVAHKMSFNLFGKYIVFSHKPRKDDGYGLNIHGHFHNTDHRSQEPELRKIKNDKQILFAVEYTDYKPLLLKTIVEEYDKSKNKNAKRKGFGRFNCIKNTRKWLRSKSRKI